MTELGNFEDMTEKFDEIKSLVDEIKDTMMNSEDCNNQFYAILQNLDSISTGIQNLEDEKSKPSDEYTILQTNILEVKKEISKMNKTVEDVSGINDIRDALIRLSDKFDTLNLNSSGNDIDPQLIVNITGNLQREINATLNDATATLYDQQQTYSDTVHRTTEEINTNLKECVDYLEKALKTTSDQAVQSLSDDMTILGTTFEKTSDNLRRSIIDIFTKIQESISEGQVNEPQPQQIQSPDNSQLSKDFEMLKNGIYNLNSNTEQRLSKLNRVISELDLFKKLEKFSQIKDLPAIGDLKHTLQNNIDRIVDQYSFTLQSSQNRNELTEITQQFRSEVYGEILKILGNASEFILDDESLLRAANVEAKTPIEYIKDKLEDLSSATVLNNNGLDNIFGNISSLKEELVNIQHQCEDIASDLRTKTFDDIRENIHEIYVNGESLKLQNKEVFEKLDSYSEQLRDYSDRIIESSVPDRNTIKDLLADIRKNISILQSGDEQAEYTYSMQDIESDIAKIRIYLNELRQNGITLDSSEFTEELNKVVLTVDSMKQQLNKIEECDLPDTLSKMKDDLTSVSTRVNKLLLTSDNSYNLIEDALKSFRELNEDILNELKSVVDQDRFQTLEEGLTALKIALAETNSYNSTINKSLLMLAEWVDSAGETITNIYNNQSKLESIGDIKTILNEITLSLSQKSEDIVSSIKEILVNTIPEQVDYTQMLSTLNDKVTEQSLIIKEQEERISKLDEKLTTILEISAKNDFSELTTKISNIDAQMEKLNKSIEKLTAYVNED